MTGQTLYDKLRDAHIVNYLGGGEALIYIARQAGCSMCVAMNGNRLDAGERDASTSNRKFEGRQGQGGRTHLLNPLMATAATIAGELTDMCAIFGDDHG